MDLGTFHSLVSTSLKRGTTLDNVIPSYSKLGLSFMERNYTFKYMEDFRILQLAIGDRTLVMDSNWSYMIKSVQFIRLIDDDNGDYRYLKRVNPRMLSGTSDEAPTGYWLVGANTLVFDNTTQEALAGEAMLTRYTDWPVANDGTHPLLITAPDAMLYQTLIHMAAYLRDAAMVAAYKELRDEALNTLTRSEDELKYDGESIQMEYIPFASQ